MTDDIKFIAVKKLIEIKGESFIKNNIDDFAISYSQDDKRYYVTFLLAPPSGNVTTDYINNLETPIKNYLSIHIDKTTKECCVLENTL